MMNAFSSNSKYNLEIPEVNDLFTEEDRGLIKEMLAYAVEERFKNWRVRRHFDCTYDISHVVYTAVENYAEGGSHSDSYDYFMDNKICPGMSYEYPEEELETILELICDQFSTTLLNNDFFSKWLEEYRKIFDNVPTYVSYGVQSNYNCTRYGEIPLETVVCLVHIIRGFFGMIIDVSHHGSPSLLFTRHVKLLNTKAERDSVINFREDKEGIVPYFRGWVFPKGGSFIDYNIFNGSLYKTLNSGICIEVDTDMSNIKEDFRILGNLSDSFRQIPLYTGVKRCNFTNYKETLGQIHYLTWEDKGEQGWFDHILYDSYPNPYFPFVDSLVYNSETGNTNVYVYRIGEDEKYKIVFFIEKECWHLYRNSIFNNFVSEINEIPSRFKVWNMQDANTGAPLTGRLGNPINQLKLTLKEFIPNGECSVMNIDDYIKKEIIDK